jgi:hypothetical protein
MQTAMYSGVKNQNVWLECKGDFVWSPRLSGSVISRSVRLVPFVKGKAPVHY